jgi:hypothetical protein
MGAARVGGYASKAQQAERLDLLRVLWQEGRPIELIAERLRIAPSTVSQLARAAGLSGRREKTLDSQSPVVKMAD